MLKIKKETLLFILEIIAIASFFSYKIARNQLSTNLSSTFVFFLFFLLLSACLGGILYPLLKLHSRRVPFQLSIISFSPFLLLLLVFVQEVVFLKDISRIVLMVSILGFIYLHLFFLIRSKKTEIVILPKLSRAKTAILCFAVAGVVYLLAASGVLFTPYPITGDEPHYLLITKSLFSDGDVNLWNNFQNKDYLEFYPGQLDAHTKTGKRGAQFQYSRHMPGFSVFILPAYALGATLGRTMTSALNDPKYGRQILILVVRLFLSVLAAALSGMFYLTMETLLKNRNISLLAWGFFSFSTPLLFFSYQIYPEVIAALISISVVYVLLINPKRSPLFLVLAGVGIGILPWFGLKYLVISFGCGLLFLISFLKQEQKLKKYVYLSLPIFLSAVFFLFFLWFLYGKLSMIAVYKGTTVEGSVTFNTFFHHDPIEFLRCWVGYLFDQRVGLLAYSPIFMLFFPGSILWFRKNKKEALSLLIPLTLYWAFCSMSYYWGGYSPPGRTLLPVLWIMGIFMGAALYRPRRKKPVFIIHLLAGLTFLNTYLLAKDTRLLFHENLSFPWAEPGKVSNVLNSLSNVFIDFTKFVPSLSSQDGITWVPLLVWGLVFLSIGYFFMRRSRKSGEWIRDRGMFAPLGIVFVVSVVVVVNCFLDIRLESEKSYPMKEIQVYFQDENTFGSELDGFWTKGNSQAEIVLKSPKKASRIELNLIRPFLGKATVQVGNAIKVIDKKSGGVSDIELIFPKPVGLAWRGFHLYCVKIREEGGFVPSKRDGRSTDNRYLGAFVKVSVD